MGPTQKSEDTLRFAKHSRLLSLLTALLGSTCGCSDDPGPEPQVCATMSVRTGSPDCPYAPHLIFNAICSFDDRTPSDELKARWDFQNDGTWDTPVKPTWWNVDYRVPEILAGRVWEVRCQVFDGDSLSSIEVIELELPNDLPKPPDIMLGRLRVVIEGHYGEVDTLRTGEVFGLDVRNACIADYDYGTYTTEYWQNDKRIYVQGGSCSTWVPGYCTGYGKVGFVIDEPGRHTFTVIANPDSSLFETNYANNRASTEVIVIP